MSGEPWQKPFDLDAVYREHVSYMWDFLRYLGVPAAELEDICHDTFVVAFRRFHTYDRSRPLRPWLTGIAVRVWAASRRRSWRRRERNVEAPVLLDSSRDPESALARKQAERLVLDALERLSPKYRVAFVLHDVEDLSVPQIAELLSLRENTVYSALRRARRQFAAAVARLEKRSR